MSKSETISHRQHMRSCLESYKKYLVEILMSKSKYDTPKYEIIEHIKKLHKDSGCCLSHKECDPDNIRFITETQKMFRINKTAIRALIPVIYSSVNAWLEPEKDGKKLWISGRDLPSRESNNRCTKSYYFLRR